MKVLSALFLGLALSAAPALATEKIDLRPPKRPGESVNSANPLLYQKPEGTGVGRGPASSASCTDAQGMIFTKGAPGFETCVRARKAVRPDDDQPLPSNRGETLNLFGK